MRIYTQEDMNDAIAAARKKIISDVRAMKAVRSIETNHIRQFIHTTPQDVADALDSGNISNAVPPTRVVFRAVGYQEWITQFDALRDALPPERQAFVDRPQCTARWSRYYTVSHNDKLLGVMCLIEDQLDESQVWLAGVISAERGAGLIERIAIALDQVVLAKHHRTILLGAYEPVVYLYRNVGFETIGVTQNDGRKYGHDVHWMRKKVNK